MNPFLSSHPAFVKLNFNFDIILYFWDVTFSVIIADLSESVLLPYIWIKHVLFTLMIYQDTRRHVEDTNFIVKTPQSTGNGNGGGGRVGIYPFLNFGKN
jgi:hypothetical protein